MNCVNIILPNIVCIVLDPSHLRNTIYAYSDITTPLIVYSFSCELRENIQHFGVCSLLEAKNFVAVGLLICQVLQKVYDLDFIDWQPFLGCHGDRLEFLCFGDLFI